MLIESFPKTLLYIMPRCVSLRLYLDLPAWSVGCAVAELSFWSRVSMWIVRLALSRPYTFVVVALLIAVLGGVSIYRMSTDIFPEIDTPVVSVVWQYFGMPARRGRNANYFYHRARVDRLGPTTSNTSRASRSTASA